MEERHQSQLVQNLLERFEFLGAETFRLNEELQTMVHPVTRQAIDTAILQEIERRFLERIQYRRAHDGAVLVPVSVVADPKLHEEWYENWHTRNNNRTGSYYWKRLEEFLSFELTRKYGANEAGRVVRSIDEATYSIMDKLANPSRREFNYKGLVVGYVQSGKTANFTALIAKAADAGYKFIIVLSGIHSVLRRQTQIRLDRELTGMNDLGIDESFIPEPSDAKRWNRITTARVRTTQSASGQIKINDLGEFSPVNVDPFDSLCNRATPTIAIIKKNVKVLERLIEYVTNSDERNRANMPVLIIDDEADQASVDSNAGDPDADPTRTNDGIRRMLALFSRKAYVGYTATPFANVLIDMGADHPVLQDDLYPRNFIVSLPEPEGYFGTRKIFSGDLSDRFVEAIEDGHDEFHTLLDAGEITGHLAQAIDQFILSCAIRNVRGDRNKPMSMLVHVSHVIRNMGVLNDVIAAYVQDISGRYQDNRQKRMLKEEFRAVWEDFSRTADSIIGALQLRNFIPDFDTVWTEIANVFSVLRIMELNSSSDDRLDYNSGGEIKVIAIGGNQLSRGLTLEGLMTSYYLRESRQYDTLLQMGRWFGYRHGYEDLTRVHTTARIWNFFEHLALVEEELRSEIYRYEEEQLTPMQMAIAIRSHTNLTVTATNKMGAGRLRQISYSGSLNQTIWMPLEQPDILQRNYDQGASFVEQLNASVGFTNVNNSGVYLANERVSGATVLEDFLNLYQVVSRERTGGPGLDYDNILQYITRRLTHQTPELTEWSVAVVGNVNPNAQNDPINYGGLAINRISRSRKYTERGYNIGVLTEPDHLRINGEEPENRTHPLLLLYVIWKDSQSRRPENPNPQFAERIDLFRFVNTARVDVLGIAIALPESRFEQNSYIGQ
jgi:hypothetical protein